MTEEEARTVVMTGAALLNVSVNRINIGIAINTVSTPYSFSGEYSQFYKVACSWNHAMDLMTTIKPTIKHKSYRATVI